MIYFIDALLWLIAIVLGLIAASRSRHLLRDSMREGVVDCARLLPRIMLGVIGAGYIAALLPQEVVGRWLGADSGFAGLGIAVLGGAFTPGGPVIGFSIGASLKGSAGTCDRRHRRLALFAMQRLFLWELPVMPQRLVWLRVSHRCRCRSWRRPGPCCSADRDELSCIPAYGRVSPTDVRMQKTIQGGCNDRHLPTGLEACSDDDPYARHVRRRMGG
jgi:hypothetical protein